MTISDPITQTKSNKLLARHLPSVASLHASHASLTSDPPLKPFLPLVLPRVTRPSDKTWLRNRSKRFRSVLPSSGTAATRQAWRRRRKRPKDVFTYSFGYILPGIKEAEWWGLQHDDPLVRLKPTFSLTTKRQNRNVGMKICMYVPVEIVHPERSKIIDLLRLILREIIWATLIGGSNHLLELQRSSWSARLCLEQQWSSNLGWSVIACWTADKRGRRSAMASTDGRIVLLNPPRSRREHASVIPLTRRHPSSDSSRKYR